MKNYKDVLESPDIGFHTDGAWTSFLSRKGGLEKFLTVNNPFENTPEGGQTVTEMAYFLNGDNVLKVLQGMYRQSMDSVTMAQVYHLMRGAVSEEIGTDTLERINKILLGTEGKERNLAEAVREWVLSSSGVFMSSQVSRAWFVVTKATQRTSQRCWSG